MPPRKTEQPSGSSSSSSVPSSSSIPPSSFTPESFERELKNLAAQAKDDTWARAARKQGRIYARVALLLTLAAFAANASLAALSPTFGAVPAARYHSALLGHSFTFSWYAYRLIIRRLPADRPLRLWLPLLAAYTPVVHALLAPMAGRLLTAVWGPVVVEAVALAPLFIATNAYVAINLQVAAGLDALVRLPRFVTEFLPIIGSFLFFLFAQNLTKDIAGGGGAPIVVGLGAVGTILTWLRTRVASQLVLFAAHAAMAPSKLLLYAVPGLVYTIALNPHLAAAPWSLALTNRALQSVDAGDGTGTGDWAVLDRRESVTGYLSVVESRSHGLRAMRCDHSLLGGEWTAFPARPVTEPIYSVFIMLEAVRLVEREGREKRSRNMDVDNNALVIGLGIGTAPAALIAHGVDTTVVEIDPAVHALASQYFHLPPNHTAVIEDAVAYTDRLVAEQAEAEQTEQTSGAILHQFDYIVHDVFTGGAEPIPLFTFEFLQNLHALLKPSGVIAINYAGDLSLPPIKAVVTTIRAVFPACRVFREQPPDKTSPIDFANVVIFCTKSGKQAGDVVFRAPQPADLLNSEMRRRFLLPTHEVFDGDLASAEPGVIVYRNGTTPLREWQEKSALRHWEVMRKVLPAKVWEMW